MNSNEMKCRLLLYKPFFEDIVTNHHCDFCFNFFHFKKQQQRCNHFDTPDTAWLIYTRCFEAGCQHLYTIYMQDVDITHL